MILSIQPHHVANILMGHKTVELRRIRPQIDPGQPVAIYATAPVSAVVATCRVSEVVSGTPTKLKRAVLGQSAITGREFDAYFRGCTAATAIRLVEVNALSPAVTLADLRAHRAYHPPQTWHFFTQSALQDLVGDHASHPVLATML